MLLTRAPLSPKTSFDLHVLGLPPAFVLSQDQTLKLTSRQSEDFWNRARPKQKLHACLQDALSASNQSDLAGAACASLPCVFTLSKSGEPLGPRRRRRFRFVTVPVAGRPVYIRTAGPASTSFFSPLRFFSEAFRGVDCSPLSPPRRRRLVGEAGVLQEHPNRVKRFLHPPEPKPEPTTGCLTLRPATAAARRGL